MLPSKAVLRAKLHELYNQLVSGNDGDETEYAPPDAETVDQHAADRKTRVAKSKAGRTRR